MLGRRARHFAAFYIGEVHTAFFKNRTIGQNARDTTAALGSIPSFGFKPSTAIDSTQFFTDTSLQLLQVILYCWQIHSVPPTVAAVSAKRRLLLFA